LSYLIEIKADSLKDLLSIATPLLFSVIDKLPLISPATVVYC